MLGLLSGYLHQRRRSQQMFENSFQTLDFSDDEEGISLLDVFTRKSLHEHDDDGKSTNGDTSHGQLEENSPLLSVVIGRITADSEQTHVERITCKITGDSYEGPIIRSGMKHGEGAIFRKLDGTKFMGSYRNNLPYEGTIVVPEKFTYTGKLDREGRFHGSSGVLVELNGGVYSGEFHHGFRDGVGKEIIEEVAENSNTVKSCTIYTGHFRRGLRHGLGTMVVRCCVVDSADCNDDLRNFLMDDNSDNSTVSYIYSGMWCNGVKDGEGVEVNNKTGEKFEGFFFHNKRHGKGVSISSRSGMSKKGMWRAGIPVDGPGWTITYTDGAEYNGEARRGQPHGRGTIRYSATAASSASFSSQQQKKISSTIGMLKANVYTGGFRNGVRHGKGICIYASGEVFDGFWVEDEPVESKDASQQLPKHLESILPVVPTYLSSPPTEPNLHSSTDVEKDIKKARARNNFEAREPADETKEFDDVSAVFDISIPVTATKYSYPNGDLFFGALDENLFRQGHGVYIGGKSGCNRYEGGFVNGKRHGPNGILITAFTKYIGEFVNDLKEGEGTLIHNDTSMYKGNFRNGMFHGQGVFCDADGRVYTGEYENGLEHGTGEERFSDGSVFRGEFKEGRRCGVGSLFNNKGEVEYSGQWFDGMMEGEGVQYCKTPLSTTTIKKYDEYKGSFVRGMKCGHGKVKTADGLSLKGKWVRDFPVDGEWTVHYTDGSAYSGRATFQTSDSDPSRIVPVPNGFGTLRYMNGDVYSGNLINGKREGRGICVFANGDQWDGTWVRDAVDAEGTGILTLADGTEHKFGSFTDELISFD